MRIYMTMGLPASGKSTFAKECNHDNFDCVRVSKDDLRALLHNSSWSRSNEKQVLRIRDAIIEDCLSHNLSVIVDDTNLHPKHLTRMQEFADKYDCELVVLDWFTQVDVDECVRRDSQRANPVGRKVIMDMYNRYLKPTITPPVRVEGAPFAIICDLDGTLADLNGRNPYDASTCMNDKVNSHVARQVRMEARNGAEIIYVSGRMDKDRPPTEAWLTANNLAYSPFKLYMRATDDTRKDSIVKQEIYERHIKGNYNILYVLDDRSQVVRMWREQGLVCWQVNEGDF